MCAGALDDGVENLVVPGRAGADEGFEVGSPARLSGRCVGHFGWWWRVEERWVRRSDLLRKDHVVAVWMPSANEQCLSTKLATGTKTTNLSTKKDIIKHQAKVQ